MRVLQLVSIVCNFGVLKSLQKTDEEIKDILKGLLNNYDPRLRPDYLGPPVEVSVDATILSFTNLDAIKMMYTVDMFFRQRWRDHRLQHDMNESLTIIVGTKHPSNIIWTPDTVFINSVVSRLHHVTVNNHKLDISPNGEVFWGTRVTVSPSCYLNLMAYPMDIQTCNFQIVSYTYSSRHLMYSWKKNPGVIIMDTKMAQFELTSYKTRQEEIIFVAGNYTVLTGSFQFRRLMGFAILQIYVPSTAIVCVSWVSLWIRRSATPARVALCITTLLTISTIWSSVNSQLPRVNYVKAIDIYLMTSFCCVIFTLLEYTIVLNSGAVAEKFRKKKKKKSKEEEQLILTPPRVLNENETTFLVSQNGRDKDVKVDEKDVAKRMAKKIEEENEKVAEKIEVFARVFFPLTYLTFNIFYWTTYLTQKEEQMN